MATVLDIQGVTRQLTNAKPSSTNDLKQLEAWSYANKVCRHTIISMLSNYYQWEMMEDKDIKVQINEYHKMLEGLCAENINLSNKHRSNY